MEVVQTVVALGSNVCQEAQPVGVRQIPGGW